MWALLLDTLGSLSIQLKKVIDFKPQEYAYVFDFSPFSRSLLIATFLAKFVVER